MADNLQFDSAADIGKDVQDSSNAVPLLPQWLLPKTGDNKNGMAVEEDGSIPNLFPGYAGHQDAAKLPGKGNGIDENHDKKDVFRPSVLDTKAARWDRWRDDERSANFSIRKDQWREGDKEQSDSHRVVRKGDSSVRQYGEARRTPGERWSDSGNRDNQDQRRESKWNTRWGRDEKETYAGHEKWGDSTKEDEALHERSPHLPFNSQDEKGGDHARPWRSNYGRGRSDAIHSTSNPSKHVPGHGGNLSSNFSTGRGRFNSGDSSVSLPFMKTQPQKGEIDHGVPYPLSYSRTKLLDIFRATDVSTRKKIIQDAVQVPSITLEAPIEPLALYAPTPQELAIFTGIDRGDINSSGAPKVNKPATQWHGNKDDLPSSLDDAKDETWNNPDGLSHEKQTYGWPNSIGETVRELQPSIDSKLKSEGFREDTALRVKSNNISEDRGFFSPGNASFIHAGAGHSSSFRERSQPVPVPIMGSSDAQRSSENTWDANVMDFPNTRIGEAKWPVSGSPITRAQASASLGRAREPPKLASSSPEDLVLLYKDPQGDIQGPFSGSDIITWFESGYFGLDLQVRLANASIDTPFSSLADVMPHLKLKARPPPGFSMSKPVEIQDSPGRLSHSASGMFHVEGETNILKGDPGYKHISSTEAENKFIESLMGASVSAALPIEHQSGGIPGYGVKNSFSMPSLEPIGGDDPHRIQNLLLERQKSLQNTYPHWPARDAAPVPLTADIVNEPSPMQLKRMPSNIDNPQQQLPLNMEQMALPTLGDRSASVVNSGISGRAPFPIPGGIDPYLEKRDAQQSHNFPTQAAFLMQQQRLHSQNAGMSPIATHPVDNSPIGLTPDKLLSLQQQQYLVQLQSNTPPVQSQQLLLLEKLLLLNQQQKQEELHLMRQQQQLLSQLISEQQTNKLVGDTAFAQLHGSLPAGIPILDHSQYQHQHDLGQTASQSVAPAPWTDANASNSVFPPVLHDGLNTQFEALMHPPHQIQANSESTWSATLPMQISEEQIRPAATEPLHPQILSDIKNKCVLDQTLSIKPVEEENFDAGSSFVTGGVSIGSALPQESSHDNEIVFHHVDVLETVPKTFEEQKTADEIKISDSTLFEETKSTPAQKGKKSSDKKSKKQKSSKNSTDTVKNASNASLSKASEVEATRYDGKSDSVTQQDLSGSSFSHHNVAEKVLNDVESHTVHKLTQNHTDIGTNIEEVSMPQLSQTQIGRSAWKHAPDFRPKSLLEIQEEHRRSQQATRLPEVSAPVVSTSMSNPWTGVVHRPSNEIEQQSTASKINPTNSDDSTASVNKKNLEDDLFWDTGIVNTGERALERAISSVSSQAEPSIENDFIEAKETKKGRKKSAKAKTTAAKTSLASETFVGSSPVDKGKYINQTQQQNEFPPAVPSGPSFGDFVLWKGEPASPPAPAWSINHGKGPKPASLRDILKEQEKKTSAPLPVLTQRPSVNQPLKIASPLPNSLPSGSNPKQKVDADLFWDPIEQPNRDDKKSSFPQLGAQLNVGGKSPSSKATLGGPSNQKKSGAGKFAEPHLSSSGPQPLQAGKKASLNKHSEALEFRRWCESESIRLIGSKDTSILEYCLKISRAEAETLLVENLAAVDPYHEFIDKFLNYKDFLPADAVEAAFKNRNDNKKPNVVAPVTDSTSDQLDTESDANTKGKKKGKKGKKVSPSILGFNVVSNRIMMGEIQTVDD